MKCPGQDMQFWKPGDIYEVECPGCGRTVEFFKDDTARRCGITSPMNPVYSVALGTSGVSPLEMAAAYATFASGGVRHPPYWIRRVEDVSGRVLEEHIITGERVLNESITFQLVDMMAGVIDEGTGQITGQAQRRLFAYDGQFWEDPGSQYAIEEVMAFLADTYPELRHGTWSSRTLPDGTEEITFVKVTGEKGNGLTALVTERLLSGTTPADIQGVETLHRLIETEEAGGDIESAWRPDLDERPK